MCITDIEKLKSVLSYCQNSLKHPETPTNPYYQMTYADGYNIPSIPTYDQLLKQAETSYQSILNRAKKIQEYELCLANIKYLLEKLNKNLLQ